jgi:hypothetical protein
MINWLKEMLNSSSNVSSSRVINFIGAISGTLLLAYDTYLKGLSPEAFGLYLAYCGGVYVLGKHAGIKGEVDDKQLRE